jgi:hypothetical protein
MTNEDYREILQSTRRMLREAGLSGIDERIMSDIRGSEGPFWDLTYYLKHLTEEVTLGSDVQLGNVLRRVRRHVRTESGEAVEGIRLTVSGEDQERYSVEQIDFAPNPELGEIARELRALIDELYEDHREDSNRQGEE